MSDQTTDDDLSTVLDAHAPGHRWSKTSIALVGVLLLACGFVAGGWVVDRRAAETTSLPAGLPAGLDLAALTGGSGGGSPAGLPTGLPGLEGMTIGTVTLVDGDALYVTATSGATVKVRVGEDASVTRTVATDLDRLRPGTTVIITGDEGADGVVDARSVAEGTGFPGGAGG